MKKLNILYITILLVSNIAKAQYNYNRGKILQKHYYEEIPFEYRGKAMVIKVNINGQLQNFLFDTGAPNVLYKDKTIGNKTKVRDANGNSSEVSHDTDTNYKLGSTEFQNIPFVVIESGKSLFEECLGVKGFIGSNSLRNSILKIDYENKKIIISDDIKNFDTSNSEELKLTSPKLQMLPYVLMVTGKTGIYAELDSGYTRQIMVSENELKRLTKNGEVSETILGEGYNSIGLWGKGAAETVKKVKLKSEVKIGNLKISPDHIETGKELSLIGNEILEKLNPIIDYKNGRVYLKKVSTFVLPKHDNPIAGLVIDGTFRVAKIWEPYIGKANIGDEILEVDGVKPNFENNCFLLNHLNFIENAKKVRLKNAKTGEDYFLDLN